MLGMSVIRLQKTLQMTLERDLVSGAKAGPFGLMQCPAATASTANAAVSAASRRVPADDQLFGYRSKSARKCTELLLTRMDCSVGLDADIAENIA